MSQLNLKTRDGELELVFNFGAHRKYERMTAARGERKNAPMFVRSCLMNELNSDDLLAMLECCLSKHHPKYRGGRLERCIEKFLDNHKCGYAPLVSACIEAINESEMFKIEGAGDDTNVENNDEILDADDPDDVASIMGDVDADDSPQSGGDKEVAPDKNDPTT